VKFKLSIFLLLIGIYLTSSGQTGTKITGKVFDSQTKDPLIGATVIIKGTSRGAITNTVGVFTYNLSAAELENAELVVSYIGYTSQSIKVRGNTNFEIYLEEDVNSLEEVVVTSSYGTKKLKQEVVGSISSVSTKDIITEQTAVSFDELLEGQTAGVYIESDGGVGEPVNIHVRGQGSLTPLGSGSSGTSTQPLIIVDGIILAEEISLEANEFFDIGDGKFSEDYMNPLAKIGIKDIESINILKDAAAVSLYGADGANGVIIITTKTGKRGPLKYNFSAQGGFSTAMNRIKYMNGEQYQELRNIYYSNSGQPQNVLEWNGVDTDWYELLNRTGSFQSYDLSASGGTEKFSYRLSFSHSNIQEPQINNDFKKYNGRISFSYSHKKLNLSLKLAPSLTEKNTPNTLYSFAVPPIIAPYDSANNFTKFETYGNPLAVANQNRSLSENKSLLNSLSLSYEIMPGLNFSSLFGLDFSDKHQDKFFSGLNETGIDNSGNIGNRILRDRQTRRWNWNARMSYEKQFNEDHYLDFLAGVETRQESVDFSYLKGENYPSAEKMFPVSEAEFIDSENDRSENTGRSFLSQMNYDYQKTWFFLLNFRIDQSSVFGTDNNTSFNGGLGGSWVISKLGLFDNINWIQFLRYRVSYGTSGNSRIGTYRAKGLYSFDDIGEDGYNQMNYANPYTAPNPFLGWEKNYKFNTGIDLTTNFRISFSLEFYHDNIKDMIVSRDVIPEVGYNSVQINGANMYNRGVEFSIRSQVISNSRIKWTSSFNISKNENKVTFLEGLESDFSTASAARAQRIGYPTSVIWGYEFVGIDPATGRELYNVDGNIVDGRYLRNNYISNNLWQPIGNSQPEFYGGFNNSLKIGKNFEMKVVMSYTLGADKMIAKERLDQYRLITNQNMPVNAYLDSWKQPGDIALYPSVTNNNPLISNSTKYIYSNSHVKLKSINLSYNFKMDKLKLIKGMRIFLNGSNLYYWFLDKTPEGSNGIAELRKQYPEMRTYSFGVNANF
jgi:TonB-linked SusC/RagA family outer membrane protein